MPPSNETGAPLVENVADAIFSLARFYESDQVVFLKALDHILIALGEQIDLLVTSSRDSAISFSTKRGQCVSDCPAVPFGVRFFSIAPVAGKSNVGATTTALDFLRALSNKIVGSAVLGGNDLVVGRLYKGLVDVANITLAMESRPKAPGVDRREASKLTAVLRTRVNEFLQNDYRISSAGAASPTVPGLLIFQRYIGRAGTGVSGHLLPSQKLGREAYTATNPVGNLSLDLSESVGELFHTGLTRWMRLPEETAENLSRTFWPDRSDQKVSRLTMLVQIHVNGVPWLALGVLFRSDDETRIEFASKLYRDILPYFTTNIRAFAEQRYLDAVIERARNLLAEDELGTLPDALNSLACIFPYQRIEKVWEDKRKKIRVKLGSRPLFAGTNVTYVSLDAERIRSALEHEREAIRARQNEQSIAIAKTRSRQARAWAHDVKNWTAPMIPALEDADRELTQMLGGEPLGAHALDTLKYVILNARCLNAASIGIENILRRKEEIGASSSAPAYLESLSREDASLWIETAFQLLLLVHAKMRLLEPDGVKLTLNWTPRWDVSHLADVLVTRFAPDEGAGAYPPGARIEEMFEKFMFDDKINVIVAFLREVVQNMKLLPKDVVANEACISITYHLEERADRIVLHINQEHLQVRKWVRDMASGLEKSLSLYGPDGANLGDIERGQISFSNETVPGGFRVKYYLPITFFHGGR